MALVTAHSEAPVVPDRAVKLQAVIDLTLDFALRLQRDPVLRASVRLAVEQTSFSRPPRTTYEQSGAAILALLRQAEEQREILPGVDVQEATSTIVGAFTGLQLMSQVHSNGEDLPERIGAFWRFVLPGLATPGLPGRLRTTPPPPPEAV